MRFITNLFIALSIASCAFAPMNSSKTARAIPEDETLVDFGFSPFPYATLASGLADKLTLSGSIEQQLFPLVAVALKYSFLDRNEGFSLAAELGTSLGMGVVKSYSGFVGPIFSWKKNWFEIYLYPKYNYVHFDKLELSDGDKADLFIDAIDPGSISYLLNALGSTWWVTPEFGLNLELKYFVLLSDPGEVRHNIIPSIGFMLLF
jgi:hypothetical protein